MGRGPFQRCSTTPGPELQNSGSELSGGWRKVTVGMCVGCSAAARDEEEEREIAVATSETEGGGGGSSLAGVSPWLRWKIRPQRASIDGLHFSPFDALPAIHQLKSPLEALPSSSVTLLLLDNGSRPAGAEKGGATLIGPHSGAAARCRST